MKHLFILLLLITNSGFSQFLPNNITPEEEKNLSSYLQSRKNRKINESEQPSQPIRSMAEWEELDRVVIAWTYYNNNGIKDILIKLVDEIKTECEVAIVTEDIEETQFDLDSEGIDWSENVTFIDADINSIWCRDYGPNSGYINDVDSLVFIDWIYNRPRPDDDDVVIPLSESFGFGYYETDIAPNDLVNTGGNFMTDGMGTAICEDLVVEENGANNQYGTSNHSVAEIDSIMFHYMGVTRYIKMNSLPHDEIHHVDMHMKLIDEERIMVGEFPEGVSDGPTIENNIESLVSNYLTPFGDEYEIIRIPMPPKNGQYHYNYNNVDYRTYTNALFVNKKIIIPFYEEQFDTTAQRIWEEAMPGYQVVGIQCNSIIPYLGAIHCITKEVGSQNPLLINVNQHSDVSTPLSDYPIMARVKHKSGISSVVLNYRIKGDIEYSQIEMVQGIIPNDEYSEVIPYQSAGTTVEYFIEAIANSGKVMKRPMTAPEGFFSFDIGGVNDVNVIEKNEVNISVFPNPASRIFKVEVNNYIGMTTAQLFDSLGRLIEDIKSSQSTLSIDLKNYSSGVYFLKINTDKETLTKKIYKN